MQRIWLVLAHLNVVAITLTLPLCFAEGQLLLVYLSMVSTSIVPATYLGIELWTRVASGHTLDAPDCACLLNLL